MLPTAVGVDVLVVWTCAREVYGLIALAEVTPQVVIQELSSVVGIEAENGERQTVFYFLNGLSHAMIPLVPDCPVLRPLCLYRTQ
jgi:hypothetical protein